MSVKCGIESMQRNQNPFVEIGKNLELFVDKYLVERMDNVTLRLHEPQKNPPAKFSLKGQYMTVIRDNSLYRGYYRKYKPDYKGECFDGNPGELTCYRESNDGINWGKTEVSILDEAPFAHNFAPFLDTRPDAPETERYKAIAGVVESGLHAFSSPDGINWNKMSNKEVISYNPDLHGRLAFDSQNVAFWSEIEGCYVCYFRKWKISTGAKRELRSISRAVSNDFLHWKDQSASFHSPNLPSEDLYTNQTHPYFRAPHIYIALPTRFSHGMIRGDFAESDAHQFIFGLPNIGSTDIMFMTSRAGASSYDRIFKHAFIRPGLDPEAWNNRANYVALNVVPTGFEEMSIYGRSGERYTLRTDGFASVNALHEIGELITKPLIFSGNEFVLNLSTSVTGYISVELQSCEGKPLPGFALENCSPISSDTIEHVVIWNGGKNVGAYAGCPIKIRFVMKDSDLYSFRFR